MNSFKNKDNLKSIKTINLNKNDVLFSEGQECKFIGIVVSGQIIISTNSFFNNEFIINTINDGEMFGENLLFSDKPFYLGTVYASKQTQVKLISKDEYINYVKNNIEEYIYLNSNKYVSLQQRSKILLQKSIREKILFFLISKSNILHSNTINIKSKEELAKFLNVERPSLSRELMKLKSEKIIDYDKHHITIIKELD